MQSELNVFSQVRLAGHNLSRRGRPVQWQLYSLIVRPLLQVLGQPARPTLAILGGAKISDKIAVRRTVPMPPRF